MKKNPHILVIDPAMHTPELDCFNNVSKLSSLPCTLHLPALHGMLSLEKERDEDIRGILIFGSGCSVYDKLPWQSELENWLMPRMLKKIPTLGLCYGHQMIAHMFGGKISYTDEDKAKQSGFREVAISPNGPFPKSNSNLIVSHNETVSTVPNDMEIFGSSPKISTDALSHKDLPVWTFQSHPEATEQFLINQNIPFKNDPKNYLSGILIIKHFLEYSIG
jgi:GMP synthase-like glutamine amidotransferase